MTPSEKKWFVMRDLKRRNSNVLAIHELAEAGLEVFTPMTQMILTICGRQQRRSVPVIQDLLFVYESKEVLDSFVDKFPRLQYRFLLGKPKSEPMTVRTKEMNQFMLAVNKTETPLFYKPGELTRAMYGRQVRIVGGLFDKLEGRLLSVKGMRKRRLIIEIPDLISVAVEVSPDFIEFV